MNQKQALEILEKVKAKLGRNYKTAIRTAWENGNYSGEMLSEWAGELQRIRNTFGPSWLVKPFTPGQVAALEWLREKPGLGLPHTLDRVEQWIAHKPATIQSFFSLEKLGYAERRTTYEGSSPIWWYLTPAGEAVV